MHRVGLLSQPSLRQGHVRLTPVSQPLGGRAATLFPRNAKKARGIRHCCLTMDTSRILRWTTVHPNPT